MDSGSKVERNCGCGAGRRKGTDVEFPTHIKGNILDLLVTNCPEKFVRVLEVGDWEKANTWQS